MRVGEELWRRMEEKFSSGNIVWEEKLFSLKEEKHKDNKITDNKKDKQ